MFDPIRWRWRAGKDLVGLKSDIGYLFNRFYELDFPPSREFFDKEKWALRADTSEKEMDAIFKNGLFKVILKKLKPTETKKIGIRTWS